MVQQLLKPAARALSTGVRASSLATHAAPASNNFVTILECGARDGLQNEKQTISTELKAEFITKLVGAGLKFIEGGAFVSPKWVPQMADTSKLLPLLPHGPGYNFPVLTPNVRAVEDIVKTGCLPYVQEVFIFGAASEGFSRSNTNCTIAESIDRAALTVEKAHSLGLRARGAVSCIVGSPFERGLTDKALVRDIAKKMKEMGCYQVCVADTIGVGNPKTVRDVVEEVMKDVPVEMLAIHCHDTYGGGIASTLAAVEAGIRVVDSSTGGIGGCPYAPGATGNISTEDIIFALHGMGYQTGVDLDKLAVVGDWISQRLGKANNSGAGKALMAKVAREAAVL